MEEEIKKLQDIIDEIKCQIKQLQMSQEENSKRIWILEHTNKLNTRGK